MSILNLYRLYFIDEDGKLWGVMKDGRLNAIKKLPSFSRFSADHKWVTGIEFSGKKTRVLMEPVGAFSNKDDVIFAQNGYYYYPSLLMKKPEKMAVLKADLLNEKGCLSLIVSEKKRARYYPVYECQVKIVPPQWDEKSGFLYYISADGFLTRTDGKKTQKLIPIDAEKFAFSPDLTTLATYKNLKINFKTLDNEAQNEFYVEPVTALYFSARENILYYATQNRGKNELWTYDLKRKENTLLFAHAHPILDICD
ncbi:MAG: hypothetical protein LBU87_00175 [Lactobacillales bacterium]|nr:hypothetical protein [Lactobacillales bacterium]